MALLNCRSSPDRSPKIPADTNRDRERALPEGGHACCFSGKLLWSEQQPLPPDRVLTGDSSPMLIPGSEDNE
jgi:hypothetical protein